VQRDLCVDVREDVRILEKRACRRRSRERDKEEKEKNGKQEKRTRTNGIEQKNN
jgi:hypothetical protein